MEISWNFVSPEKWEPCKNTFVLTITVFVTFVFTTCIAQFLSLLFSDMNRK